MSGGKGKNMKHCSLGVEVGYLNMQIVFQKAQTKRTVELLLLLVRYGDFNYPDQGGIQSGARVNTLSALGVPR